MEQMTLEQVIHETGIALQIIPNIKSGSNGNTLLGDAIINFTASGLATVIGALLGIGGFLVQEIAATIIGGAISTGFSAMNILYYHVTIYELPNNPFEQKLVYSFYTDSKHSHKLYQQNIYLTKIPFG